MVRVASSASFRTPVVAASAGALGNLAVALAGTRVTSALARVSAPLAVVAGLLFVALAAAATSWSVVATLRTRGVAAKLSDAVAGYGLGVLLASWAGVLVAGDLLLHGWAAALARTVVPCAVALVVIPAAGAAVASRRAAA